jgi:RND family efflux transporter MFP subunit
VQGKPITAGRFTLTLMLAALLASCSKDEAAREPILVQNLDTLLVAPGDSGHGRAWDGVVEAVRESRLSAQTQGRVAEVLHDINDQVAEGAVLVRLSSVEQQAQVDSARAQLRAAEAAVAEAESTYQRYVELSQGQYVSKLQLDQLLATRDSAIAARDAAAARLADTAQQADYTTIRAPYAGIIASRDVEPGESIVIGQQLMTLFSPDALRIEVSIPQSDAERVRLEPSARIILDGGRMVDAQAVTVFPSADPSTHAVKVRVQLPALNPEAAVAPQPGVTAKVAFPALKTAAYPRVPESALVRRGEVNAVYVLADGRLSLRQLRLGQQSGDMIEVIAGLKPGETIAVDPIAAAQALIAARSSED